MRKAKVEARIEIYASDRRMDIEDQIRELRGLLQELETRRYLNMKSSYQPHGVVTWSTGYSCEACDHVINRDEEVVCAFCERKICDWCHYWDKSDNHEICKECHALEVQEEQCPTPPAS